MKTKEIIVSSCKVLLVLCLYMFNLPAIAGEKKKESESPCPGACAGGKCKYKLAIEYPDSCDACPVTVDSCGKSITKKKGYSVVSVVHEYRSPAAISTPPPAGNYCQADLDREATPTGYIEVTFCTDSTYKIDANNFPPTSFLPYNTGGIRVDNNGSASVRTNPAPTGGTGKNIPPEVESKLSMRVRGGRGNRTVYYDFKEVCKLTFKFSPQTNCNCRAGDTIITRNDGVIEFKDSVTACCDSVKADTCASDTSKKASVSVISADGDYGIVGVNSSTSYYNAVLEVIDAVSGYPLYSRYISIYSGSNQLSFSTSSLQSSVDYVVRLSDYSYGEEIGSSAFSIQSPLRSLDLYSNPISVYYPYLSAKIDLSNSQNLTVKITNTSCPSCYSKKVYLTGLITGINYRTLDMSNLYPGSYTVSIIGSDGKLIEAVSVMISY